MCRRRARADFRRCAHSGGCRGGLNVVASRPRSAAPAKITPARLLPARMFPRPLRFRTQFPRKRRLGAVGALRMVAKPNRNVREMRVVRPYAGHPWCPASRFSFAINGWINRRQFAAGISCTPGRRARGDSRRCRGARAACPKTGTSPGTARVSTASRISPSLTTKATKPSRQSGTPRANPKRPLPQRHMRLTRPAGGGAIFPPSVVVMCLRTRSTARGADALASHAALASGTV